MPEPLLLYLPQDNSLTTNPDAELVVSRIAGQLGSLLSKPDDAFWETVDANAPGLATTLDSYLCHTQTSTPDSTKWDGPARAALLYDRGLLAVPQLLDLCVLYGRTNAPLMRQLLTQLVTLQPRYTEDVAALSAAMGDNLLTIAARCRGAALAVSRGKGEHLIKDLTDGVMYARDAALSLIALLDTYPRLAPPLMGPPGGLQLAAALGAWYDSVLQVLEHQAHGGEGLPQGPLGALCVETQAAVRRLLFLLLAHGVVDDPHRPLDAAAALSAGPGPRADDEAARARGGACVAVAEAAQGPGDLRGALLRDCHAEQGLGNRMLLAHSHGAADLSSHMPVLGRLLGVDLQAWGAAAAGPASPSGASSKASATLPAPQNTSPAVGKRPAAVDEDAVLQSLVSQVRDVLPEYGEGFVAAALQAMQLDAERVIHCLLEGSLPSEVACLDPNMPLKGATARKAGVGKGKAAANGHSAGKGKAAADAHESSHANGGSSTATATHSIAMSHDSSSPDAKLGTNPARPMARATAKVLTRVQDEERDAIARLALASQWEYDDEYDDSFDDGLGTMGAAGRADAEGDEAAVAPPPPIVPGRGKQAKLWVLDGRIYNYAKPGAVAVADQAAAQAAVEASKAEKLKIHGLGPGGNTPTLPRTGWQPSAEEGVGNQGGSSQGGSMQGPRGGRGGRGGRGRGGRGSHGNNAPTDDRRAQHAKSVHKAAVGNHHRKDRAMRKQGLS